MRVLLVEDEPQWQQGIAALLALEGITLVATVDNADEAEIWFDAEPPDSVLIDWKIKGSRDGLALARSLEAKGFSPRRIVLVTGSPPEQIPAHAYGYVPKSQISSQLIPHLQSLQAETTCNR
jgi:DNA-binding NarL/FixJ family response regulator